MKIKVFTTPTCIKCRRLKSYLAEIDAEKVFIDATSPEGKVEASSLGVVSVPTAFVYDAQGKELGVAHDIDELENFL
jgi:glutaredoxin